MGEKTETPEVTFFSCSKRAALPGLRGWAPGRMADHRPTADAPLPRGCRLPSHRSATRTGRCCGSSARRRARCLGRLSGAVPPVRSFHEESVIQREGSRLQESGVAVRRANGRKLKVKCSSSFEGRRPSLLGWRPSVHAFSFRRRIIR